MKLSAPIYRLKRQARTLSRDTATPLHEALDQIAALEGYASWSLLAAQYAKASTAGKLLSRLKPGDLALIAARPGQGKTLLGLRLCVEASKSGNRSFFFTLEYGERDCQARLDEIAAGNHRPIVDCSDGICADWIISRLAGEPQGTVAIVDYLQLLDQRRDTPPLMEQIRSLRDFAKSKGISFAFLSQIDRSFESRQGSVPGVEDVRLPNPLDIGLFDQACFLHAGVFKFLKIRSNAGAGLSTSKG